MVAVLRYKPTSRTAWLALAFFAIGACATTDSRCICTSATHAAVALRLAATSCKLKRDRHEVVMRVYESEEQLQQFKLEAEGFAYEPVIDLSLDINADGIPDVAVATGKGRAGDGMHYWIVSLNPLRLADAGEAPQLTWATAGARVLFALVPGSGDIQATRIDYQLRGGLLAPVQAYQFKIRSAGGLEMTLLRPKPDDPSAWSAISSRNLTDEDAQVCMSGGHCP